MLITKEQQEAWVDAYIKEKHTQDECIGFIDGINKVMDAVKNNAVLPDVVGRSEQLVCENCGKADVRDEGDWCDNCLNDGF
jgi:hypothetical protein